MVFYVGVFVMVALFLECLVLLVTYAVVEDLYRSLVGGGASLIMIALAVILARNHIATHALGLRHAYTHDKIVTIFILVGIVAGVFGLATILLAPYVHALKTMR